MISSIFRKIAKFLWLLPGFLLWASFPPMGEKIDCLFALAPLLWLARRRGVRTNAKVWFANGFFFWFATLAWMPAIVKNGGPWPLVVLGWGALSAYCALYFAAFGCLASRYWTWVRGNPLGTAAEGPKGYGWRLLGLIVVEPVLWAGLELVRSRFLGGFAWNQLGVAPVNGGFGAPAVLGGVYLVSAIVVLVNGTIASMAERMFDRTQSGVMRYVRSVETFIPVFMIWSVFVLASRFAYAPGAGEPGVRPPLRAALVQRNFPCVFERESRAGEDPLEVYGRLVSAARYVRPSLVVLPESALCEFGPVGSARAARFAEYIRGETGATAVIAGGGRHGDGKEYNSAALYSVDGSMQVYDKVHLVPFGEYIPGDKLITSLQKFAPVGSCTAGELKTLTLPGGTKAGVAICYEDTDSAQVRRLVEKGADVLVFITNDSWFLHSDEAVQHSWQAVARAVETGLPVLRVGNSGVTGTVLADGKASWLSGPDGRPLVDAAASMCDEVVPGRAEPTPYVRLGDKPLLFAFVAVLAVVVLTFRRRQPLQTVL